jgi:hypothetical protein
MIAANSKVAQQREQPAGCSLSLSALEARERANLIQINAEVRPEETEPSEPCDRITPDEYREEPELLAVVQPNVLRNRQCLIPPGSIANVVVCICGEGAWANDLR